MKYATNMRSDAASLGFKQSNSVRQMLLALDVPSYLTDLAIPFVGFLPGTVDPDSASVIEIIKAVQRGLNRAGYSVRVTGILGARTAAALDEVAPDWREKPLMFMLASVIRAYRNPDPVLRIPRGAVGLGSYFDYEGAAPGPLPGWMVGTPPGPLGASDDDAIIDQGMELTFGKGISDSSNMVPIPRWDTTAMIFKSVQRETNRLLSLLTPSTPIPEDSIIGTTTLKAVRRVMGEYDLGPVPSSTMQLASKAFTIASVLQTTANKLGVSPGANKGPTYSGASSSSTPTRRVTKNEVNTAGFGGSTWWWLLAAAGVAWYASTKKKGK